MWSYVLLTTERKIIENVGKVPNFTRKCQTLPERAKVRQISYMHYEVQVLTLLFLPMHRNKSQYRNTENTKKLHWSHLIEQVTLLCPKICFFLYFYFPNIAKYSCGPVFILGSVV